MKILKIDRKNREIVVATQTLNDLWHLEKIIEKGDIVSGHTDRKIKASKEGEKTLRQTIFVRIEVEDAHFQEFSQNLRVNGIIIDGKPEEFVELKSHHSLDVKIGEKFFLQKKEIKNWQVERLKKAEKESNSSKLLAIVLDDEEAELAFINQFAIEKKATIKAKKQGKMYAQEKDDYLDKIYEKMVALAPNKIIVAGPGFTKESYKKFCQNKDKKLHLFMETINSIGETGFNELISTGKLDNLEKELELSSESKTIEDFMEKLAKQKADYGNEKIKELINSGNIEKLIVSETFLMEKRDKAEELMELAEKVGAEIKIISSKNPLEKTIHGFGGVVCTKRYKE